MRFLCLALLLIAPPLLAQEPSEGERRADADAKDAEAKRYAERAEELRRLAQQRSKWGATEEDIRRALEDLRSKSEAKRQEAMDELRRVTATLEELLPILAQALEDTGQARADLDVYRTDARTLYLGALGSEAISGSADGTDYTLKSLGDGKYDLHATKRDDDGRLMEEWKDQGTLKELQGKYAFLKGGLAIQLTTAPLTLRVDTLRAMGLARATAPPAVNWGDAQLWGGGGKVGVTVVAPSEELRFHLELPEGAGFIVQQVVPGSRAEQIGIRRMDILLKLDGELIDSPIQLRKLNEKTGILEMIRRSETRKIDLATVPEPPAAATTEPVEVAPAGAR